MKSTLALVAGSALLALPGLATAKTKKKPAEPQPAPVVEKAPSMWKHESTKPFLGALSVERYTLSNNGLKLLVVSDKSAPTVSYHTYFDVGSSDEEEGVTGIAHLFEHMMFKATDQYADGHFSEALESAGSPDLNAWTWLDITAYHESVAKEHLQLVIDLESARMDGLIVTDESLKPELEVVINERRYRVDDSPDGLIDEQLWALAFEKNRYHWPTIGWRADLDKMDAAHCTAFYRDYYAPNNATVVVVGDVDTQDLLERLEKAYGAIPSSQLNRRDHGVEPEQTEPRKKELEIVAESEMFDLGYKVPEMTHPDYPALQVLDAILSAGNSSRLDRRLVDSEWATSVQAFLPIFQHEALYTFLVSMRPGKAADAGVQIVRNEIADLRDKPVSQEELDRARNQLLAYLWGEMEGNSGIASFLGFNEIAGGGWEAARARIDAIGKVTVDDVQRVAKTFLTEARSSVVVGHPKGKKIPSWKAKDLPKAGVGSADALAAVLGRPTEGPPALEAGKLSEKETGGWTRLMMYDPTVPLVHFAVALPFGSRVEDAAKLGITNVTAEMLLRGTRDRSRDAFERTLEGLGASVTAAVSEDQVTFQGTVLSANWPKVAALLSEAFEQPRFDAEDLADLIGEIKADLIESRNNDRWLGRRFYEQGLFAGHPYGRDVLGNSKSLAGIKVEDVREFYTTWFSSRGAIVALLGAFDAGAGSDLANLAGKLEGAGKEVATADAPAAPEGRKFWLVAKPDRSQVQIHLGHFFPAPTGKDHAAAWVANEAFGGYGFGARLMKEVREKNGYSYGAYAGIVPWKDTTTYTIWVFPAIDYAEKCLKLVLDLYQQFATDGLSETELTYAKGSILNGAAFYEDTPRKRLDYVIRKKSTGFDPVALLPLVRDLTLDDVNAAARTWFHPDAMFGTVVAPAEWEPTLEAVVGPVDVVPYDRE